jgi:hypothetical protein
MLAGVMFRLISGHPPGTLVRLANREVAVITHNSAGGQPIVMSVLNPMDEPLPQPTVNAAVVFTMTQLADFLAILRDTPEGDGNLLDHSSILCTSEISDGVSHTVDEFPILIAGGGNGRLNAGVHVRDEGRNASDAVLTALHGAGVDLPEWGVGPGRSETPVDELLA